MKVFAHRGASATYAEHTRAAFAHALAVGADGIETDVQLSADGHLVCWHDATLDRTSSGTGLVHAHRLGQLRQFDVHSWKTAAESSVSLLPSGYGNSHDQLVTLDELTEMLVTAGRAVELAVEMKTDTYPSGVVEEAVLGWLQRWGFDASTSLLHPHGVASQVSVSVMSFSSDALRRVSVVVPPSQLCSLFDVADASHFLVEPGPGEEQAAEMLGPSVGWISAHESMLETWTRTGRIVRMWTLQTDKHLAVARRCGVQQITVDDPEWALRAVRAAVLR